MSLAETFRLVLFLTVVIAVYVLAPAILLRWIRSRGKEHLFNRTVDLAIFIAALIGIGCVIDAFREPYTVEITHVTVPVTTLQPGARLRIVHISDIHSGERVRLEEKLPQLIAAEHPDLIVFTGDAVNVPAGVPVFQKLMSNLTAIAPVFAVRGNWDFDVRSDQRIYAGTAVQELTSGVVNLNIRGQKVAIVGQTFYGSGAKAGLASVEPDVPSIVLLHSPDAVYETPHASIVFAGHTHGGQIRLPWYGALVTLSKYGKRFETGLYRVNDTWLYVNRGIGMEMNAPVRFLCKPEITVVDLVGAGE